MPDSSGGDVAGQGGTARTPATVLDAAASLLTRPLRLLRRLSGGEHATTLLVTDERAEYVVRAFPAGDPAVRREVQVLKALGSLGSLVPGLVAHSDDPALPLIVTTRVAGGHPAPDLPASTIARQMAMTLARIHRVDGTGLRDVPERVPSGQGRAGRAARELFGALGTGDLVLTHGDFWCGNALWEDAGLTGVVDWSGAGSGPRARDIVWCRQDLVLLGHPEAAEELLLAYEAHAGRPVIQLREWDIHAAASAEPRVEEWAANYSGIGRTEITGAVLRQRLEEWITFLLT